MSGSANKLGTMPLPKLIMKMSVPMMISMFVQALYNVVDSMFVAQLSEDALTAVSLAFPIQSVMSAIAVGTGVGTSTYVSRALGTGNREDAEKAANTQIFISACYSVVFLLLGLFFSRGFFVMQTDITSIIEFGTPYLTIVCVFSVGNFYGQNFEKLLISTGNSTQSMISQACGAVFNLIMDPILIFGVGPIPAMGTTGAAVATVMGQILAAIIAYIMNLKYNTSTRISFRKARLSIPVAKNIYAVGVPSMLTVGLASVMSFSMNQIILGFGTTATAVFGVWLKLQNFAFMPVFGLNNGTSAIYAYNYGAKNYERIRGTIKIANIIGLSATMAFTLVYIIFTRQILGMFNASENMMSIGIPAIRTLVLSLPFGAFCLLVATSFKCQGRSRYSLLVAFLRQAAILLLVAWLLSKTGKLHLVWFAPLVAETISAVITQIFDNLVHRKIKREFFGT